PVVLEETEVDRQLVRVFRRSQTSVANRPLIPIELRDDAPGVATRIGGKVISGIGEEGQTEQSAMPRIDAEGVLIEEVEDAEVARDQDQAAAVVAPSQAGGTRLLHLALAAEIKGLAEIGARAVERGDLVAALLQLEVLDCTA